MLHEEIFKRLPLATVIQESPAPAREATNYYKQTVIKTEKSDFEVPEILKPSEIKREIQARTALYMDSR